MEHAGESLPREIEDPAQSPEREVESKELDALVAKSLLTLRPQFRALIVLRDLQGLSYQEIGAIVGCSEKAVKSRLFRARAQLRETLRPHVQPE